jgi:hypothetical protein
MRHFRNAYMHNLEYQRSVRHGSDGHEVAKIDGLHSYFNSVSIITGAQNSGKTTALNQEIIPMSHLPQTHLIVYVKKKSYDPTVEAARPLYRCAFIEVSYDEAEERIRHIIELKQKYYKLLREAQDHSVDPNIIPKHVQDPNEAQQLLDDLYCDDFSQPWLNTILVFDDCGNSKLWKNKDGYFMNLFKLCRDANATAYLLIHGFNQLDPQTKENCAVVWIGRNLSRERLAVIHRQINTGVGYDEFIATYFAMPPSSRFMIVDNLAGTLDYAA